MALAIKIKLLHSLKSVIEQTSLAGECDLGGWSVVTEEHTVGSPIVILGQTLFTVLFKSILALIWGFYFDIAHFTWIMLAY